MVDQEPKSRLRLMDAGPRLPRYKLPGRNGTGRRARGSYDASKSVVDTRRHWTAADLLDVVAANSLAVRSILRKRSRYEAANNCYARGMIEILTDDTIGTGPRLQMATSSDALNGRIERDFTQWSEAVNLAGVLRTMRKARIDSGESFLVLVDNPGLMLDAVEPSPVKLDLQLLEADQVETPMLARGSDWKEGIRFDGFKRPTAYAVLDEHPGSLLASGKYRVVPASNVIHWFRIDRPGQIRGLPEMHPALELYAQLRDYTKATLTSAELMACLTAIMTTTATEMDGAQSVGYEDGSTAPTGPDLFDLERGTAMFAPMGWDLKQLRPEQPPTTYEMFKHEVLKEIARCLCIPWNVAAGDSSGYNYASGRLDHQSYDRTIRVDQRDCELKILNRIFAAWLAEASTLYQLRTRRLRHVWFWRRRPHVDPLKEAQAQALRLESNVTNLALECSEFGYDWEEILAQRAREFERMKELGISTTAPAASTPAEDAEDAAQRRDEDGE